MAESVVDSILQTVVLRLRNIKKINGYEFDAASVTIVDRDENSMITVPLSIVVDQKEAEVNEDLSCPGNPAAIAYDVEIQIDGISRQLDENGQAIETFDRGVTENQMISAIMEAVVDHDPSMWHTLGGNAVNTWMASRGPIDAPGFDGGRVTLQVTYRVDEVSPSVSR